MLACTFTKASRSRSRMPTVRVYQVDAFTTTIFTGNPAGVVLDAERLDEQQMRMLARELNSGDTAFVMPPAGPDEDLHVRFFSPRKEMAFVGHATLAAHAVLQKLDPRPVRRQGGRTGVVEVRATGHGLAISQPAPAPGREISAAGLDEVLSLLGLDRSQLEAAATPRVFGTANTRLLLPLKNAAALDAAHPMLEALAALSPRIGAQGYFLYVHGRDEGGVFTESRMFCPALGIDEDAVSGNAHTMLGVQLLLQGLLPAEGGIARFTGLQGRHLGRGGRVAVELALDADGRAHTATIAGHAAIVFETTITLP
nr:MAG: hypothetical protein DIU62_01105 [Pseudomonadota bacterium]